MYDSINNTTKYFGMKNWFFLQIIRKWKSREGIKNTEIVEV